MARRGFAESPRTLKLLAAIAVNAVLFWRIDRPAGWLLAPYAAWVAFACLLNFALWRLN